MTLPPSLRRRLGQAKRAMQRAIRPAAPVDPVNDAERSRLMAEFDAEYYLSQGPGIVGEADALFDHFMAQGWRAGLDPSPRFSTRFYLESYEDIALAGINPFLHYLRSGRAEGRRGHGIVMGKNRWGQTRLSESDYRLAGPFVDVPSYRAANPDMAGLSDDEVIDHALTQGWREGRDPRPGFSVAYYLSTNPDVLREGRNPILHYIFHGQKEGRMTAPSGGLKLTRDPAARTVAQRLTSVVAMPGPDRPAPPETWDRQHLRIDWVVPDFSRGSGGHATIFRMIRLMEDAGHQCRIWIEFPSQNKTADEARDTLNKHFQCLKAGIGFLEEGFFQASGDAVIATGWTTAHAVARTTGFAGRFYFVQDHEPEFYPTGTDRILASESYGLPLDCLCASPWLEGLMRDRYGRWARGFHLAYDHAAYRVDDPARLTRHAAGTAERPVKIAIYARDHTERRAVQLALMALDRLGAAGAPIEAHFFGSAALPFLAASYPAWHHGILDPQGLARLYADCDLGLCFSATNYSLVPQEMMAAGLPVVELDGESTRAIFPEGVVTLAGPDPADIADKIAALAADPARRIAQGQRALDWVGQFSWQGAADTVLSAITERLAEASRPAAPAVLRPRAAQLDVVIPTYNGLAEIQPLVERLRQQKLDGLQIFCIDSSSTDGTADWLRAQADVSLTVIPKADFQHGRTRNDGAALGRAPLIAFLTQDALPAGPDWAGDIVTMFGHYPRAAGLFGRHIAWPQHSKFVRDEIAAVFKNLLVHPLALSKDTDAEKWFSRDQGWRKLLHFYSDNNSAMRREVWWDIPYPEIPYGEDQVWAKRIIEAGFQKLYAPTAAVFHSHDYSPEETFARSRTEAGFFFTHFGYRLGDGTETQLEARISREQEAVRRLAVTEGVEPAALERRLAVIAAKHRGWRAGLAEKTSLESAPAAG